MSATLNFSCCESPRVVSTDDEVISESKHVETSVCEHCGTQFKLTYDEGRLTGFSSSTPDRRFI
jgi:hypothetical protein